jgi:hypothetical protein
MAHAGNYISTGQGADSGAAKAGTGKGRTPVLAEGLSHAVHEAGHDPAWLFPGNATLGSEEIIETGKGRKGETGKNRIGESESGRNGNRWKRRGGKAETNKEGSGKRIGGGGALSLRESIVIGS